MEEEKKKEVAKSKPSGFAKGFLLGANKPKPKKESKEPVVEDLSHIKAKPKEDSLKLAEIEAMKKEVLEKQNQWMTPELMKAVWENEKLRTAMQDPIFLQVFYRCAHQ